MIARQLALATGDLSAKSGLPLGALGSLAAQGSIEARHPLLAPSAQRSLVYAGGRRRFRVVDNRTSWSNC